MITLRKATVLDIPMLVEMRRLQLIDEGLTPEPDIAPQTVTFFEEVLPCQDYLQLLAEKDGEIVATAALHIYQFAPSFSNATGKRGYIASVYTFPDHRGQGISTQILRELLAIGKQRGIISFWLNASKMGAPVYQKLGFTTPDVVMELRKALQE